MNRNLIILLLSALLVMPVSLNAQTDPTDADANFEDGNYEVALGQYLKLIKREKNNVHYNYRIGVCYLNTNFDKAKALPFLHFVDSVKNGNYENIQFDLARAYFYNHQFDKATEQVKKCTSSGNMKPEQLAEADRLLENCRNAKSLIAKPVNVTFINLGNNINSKQDDYIPFITEDELNMVFSSNRKYNNDYQQFLKGVYFSEKSGGNWGLAKSAGSKINSDEHQEAVGINKDASLILVHLDRLDAPHEIFYTEKKKTAYSELLDMGKNVNSKFAEAGASISMSGDTLFFASDRPGGLGGFDIYMAMRLPDGSWGIPSNLGEPVNSPLDENYPSITSDGNILYFSSTGHNSMGGYDVFRAKKAGNGWSEPANLGYPLNDTYDNYNLTLTNNARYGYLSSSKPDGLGGLDIYRVILNDVPPTNIVYTGKLLVGDSINSVPASKVDSAISMTVYNKDKNNDVYATYTFSTRNSKYTIALPPGNWLFEIKGKAYQPYTRTIAIRDEQPLQTLILQDIYLIKK